MAKRERIYRGFAPDESGDKVVTVNGEQICGRWVYGGPPKPGADEPGGQGLQIVPETVGEWTGKLDRVGNRVYEDDIFYACLRLEQHGAVTYGAYANPFNDDKFSEHVGFYVDWKTGAEKDISRKDLGFWCSISRVIGNRWETPDLLTN